MYADDLFSGNQESRILARVDADYPFDDLANRQIPGPILRRKPNVRKAKERKSRHGAGAYFLTIV